MAAQMIIVPDASVILKWVFKTPEEKHTEQALLVLDSWVKGRINLIVPSLWCFEVGNILGLKSAELAADIMALLLDYHFEEQAMTAEICRQTLFMMEAYRVTFYDAAYHAVALAWGAILLTADEAYVRKTEQIGSIMILKDWQ